MVSFRHFYLSTRGGSTITNLAAGASEEPYVLIRRALAPLSKTSGSTRHHNLIDGRMTQTAYTMKRRLFVANKQSQHEHILFTCKTPDRLQTNLCLMPYLASIVYE